MMKIGIPIYYRAIAAGDGKEPSPGALPLGLNK